MGIAAAFEVCGNKKSGVKIEYSVYEWRSLKYDDSCYIRVWLEAVDRVVKCNK